MTAGAAGAAPTRCRHFFIRLCATVLMAWSAVATAQDITVTPPSIPVPVQGVPYSVTFVGSDGVAPYQFLVSAGLLPAGLSLSASGALTGTPTTAQAYGFTITVSDALGRELDLVGTGAVTGVLSITAPPVLAANTAYSGQIQVTGGTGPYTFTVDSGALPPGMSLGADGLLAGTPTTPGTYMVVIRVTDANGLTSLFTLNISVAGSSVQIPANAPWMLALATLALAWLGRRELPRRRRAR